MNMCFCIAFRTTQHLYPNENHHITSSEHDLMRGLWLVHHLFFAFLFRGILKRFVVTSGSLGMVDELA